MHWITTEGFWTNFLRDTKSLPRSTKNASRGALFEASTFLPRTCGDGKTSSAIYTACVASWKQQISWALVATPRAAATGFGDDLQRHFAATRFTLLDFKAKDSTHRKLLETAPAGLKTLISRLWKNHDEKILTTGRRRGQRVSYVTNHQKRGGIAVYAVRLTAAAGDDLSNTSRTKHMWFLITPYSRSIQWLPRLLREEYPDDATDTTKLPVYTDLDDCLREAGLVVDEVHHCRSFWDDIATTNYGSTLRIAHRVPGRVQAPRPCTTRPPTFFRF